jgi:hypothetical protein
MSNTDTRGMQKNTNHTGALENESVSSHVLGSVKTCIIVMLFGVAQPKYANGTSVLISNGGGLGKLIL